MKLYESLYIFLRYKQDIGYLMELMVDLGYREKRPDEWNPKDKAHYISLYNSILLNIVSYRDEYNENFFQNSEPEFRERILQVKRIAKPALKKVNTWKDLKAYRNDMIAHNFRLASGKFSFDLLGQYNAPRTYRDLALLRKHLSIVQAIIEAEFELELPNINSFIASFPVAPQQVNYENIESELTDLISEVNQLCLDNGKIYQLQLEYFKMI